MSTRYTDRPSTGKTRRRSRLESQRAAARAMHKRALTSGDVDDFLASAGQMSEPSPDLFELQRICRELRVYYPIEARQAERWLKWVVKKANKKGRNLPRI